MVKIKAFGTEPNYLRSVPMHHSQQEIETGEGYAVFQLQIYPYAWEFKQELFSRIDQIEVLEPQKLRDEMLFYINKVKARYEE